MKITVSLQDKIRMKPQKNVKSYKLSEIFHESFSMKKFPRDISQNMWFPKMGMELEKFRPNVIIQYSNCVEMLRSHHIWRAPGCIFTPTVLKLCRNVRNPPYMGDFWVIFLLLQYSNCVEMLRSPHIRGASEMYFDF